VGTRRIAYSGDYVEFGLCGLSLTVLALSDLVPGDSPPPLCDFLFASFSCVLSHGDIEDRHPLSEFLQPPSLDRVSFSPATFIFAVFVPGQSCFFPAPFLP